MSSVCPEYGFELRLVIDAGISPDRSAAVVTGFVEHVERLGLSAAGAGDDDAWHFIITRVGGQAIDADRSALERWARAQAEVREVLVGPLVDLAEDLS